jgi:hypothetical protein
VKMRRTHVKSQILTEDRVWFKISGKLKNSPWRHGAFGT